MEGERIALDNHIFFIKFSEKMPEHYFQLAQLLGEWNITLVPLTFAQWQEIPRHHLQFVLTAVTDLSSRRGFGEMQISLLALAAFSRRICLFNLNSFEPPAILNKLNKNNYYFHFPLPGDYRNLARSMAKLYYQLKKGEELWPGGRRFKLPGLVSPV
jgi:hypothetical protein